MLNAMVVDDEEYVLEDISAVLKSAGVNVVAAFSQPKQALNWFFDHVVEIDAVFLDVTMPALDGFAVADVIKNINWRTPIVFVTAYDQYAVKAFEIAALDYIVKPLTIGRVKNCLQRITTAHQEIADTGEKKTDKPVRLQLAKMERGVLLEKKRLRSLLLKKLSGKHTQDVLLFRAGDWQWIEKKRVSCFSKEKNSKYVQVIVGGDCFETTENLREFVLNFSPADWINCYRAVFVNINYVLELSNCGRYNSWLLLEGTEKKIPVNSKQLAVIAQLIYDRENNNQRI